MSMLSPSYHATAVALRKESVDRNVLAELFAAALERVALRKESVDRNKHPNVENLVTAGSLSARRAWIEIPVQQPEDTADERRSPQGERG